MQRSIICATVALAVFCGVSDGAKKKKKESEVTKTLKEQYPDATTEITATNEVNGVKVYDVSIKGKNGESTAQITGPDRCRPKSLTSWGLGQPAARLRSRRLQVRALSGMPERFIKSEAICNSP